MYETPVRWKKYQSQKITMVTIITYSYLEISLTSVFLTIFTFENNFGIKYKFMIYLKESCDFGQNNISSSTNLYQNFDF